MGFTRPPRRSVGAALWVVLVLGASQASAVPRYSARYEQRCALCHVNPSGGGLRASYASQKLVPEEIAWSRAKPRALEDFEPTITKHVMIGTDFRELYVGANIPEARLNFFQMQADLYFNFQFDPKISLYYDRGQSNSYELFGLGYLLPTLYVKAGRFVPSYGWKFDDHTLYVRDELGFKPPANSDVGLEVGWSKGPIDVQAGVVNGNRGSTLDNDVKVAGVLNAVYRCHVGPLGAALGVSGYRRPEVAREHDTGGAYGYLTWRRFTWLGEVDLFRQKPAGGALTEGIVTSQELTYLLRQGLELIATHDFFDPDKHRGTGAKERWGGGIFVMPYPYLTLEGLLRKTEFENGVSFSGRDFTETVLQLHLLY